MRIGALAGRPIRRSAAPPLRVLLARRTRWLRERIASNMSVWDSAKRRKEADRLLPSFDQWTGLLLAT